MANNRGSLNKLLIIDKKCQPSFDPKCQPTSETRQTQCWTILRILQRIRQDLGMLCFLTTARTLVDVRFISLLIPTNNFVSRIILGNQGAFIPMYNHKSVNEHSLYTSCVVQTKTKLVKIVWLFFESVCWNISDICVGLIRQSSDCVRGAGDSLTWK